MVVTLTVESANEPLDGSPQRASTALARRVVQAMLAGELPMGAMLPAEADLARQHGVGRSTVREALRLLEVWGAVEVRQGRTGGAMTRRPDAKAVGEALWIVMQFDQVSLAELLDTRRIFDLMLARAAAEDMTNEDVLDLAEATRGLTDHVGDVEQYGVFNDRFHQVLVAACGNRALRVLVEATSSLTTDLIYELGDRTEWRRRSVELRQGVFRAIAGGRADDAERAMARYRDEMSAWWVAHCPEAMYRPIDVLRDDRPIAPVAPPPRVAGSRTPVRAGERPVTKASTRVARAITRQLLGGQLREGDVLPPETELAQRHNVGRSTLREALHLLEVWGVVEIRDGRTAGAQLRRPDAKAAGRALAIVVRFDHVTLAELFHTRTIFDVMTARLAAEHMTADGVLGLAETIRSLGDHVDDHELYFAFNDQFFRILLAASGNRALRALLDAIKSITVDVMYAMGNPLEWRGQSVTLRTAVFRAIAAGDPDETERQMRNYRDAMFGWWSERFPEEMASPMAIFRGRLAAPTARDLPRLLGR